MAGLLPLLIASLAMCSADNPLSSLKDALPSVPKPSVPSVKDVNQVRDAVAGNVSDAAGSFGRGVQKEIAAVKQPIDETIAFIGSSQCQNVKKILGVAYENYEGDEEPPLEKLTLTYIDPGVRTIFNITTAAARIAELNQFNPAQKLYIYIHGFTDDPTKSSFSAIDEALLSQGQSNVLALDASPLIHWLYLRSSTYVRYIGEKLGEVLVAMVNKGLNPDAIHIIGHSLGAHISSFTGKTFTNLTGLQVGRITGLDPAGPCFSHVDPDLRMKATDAIFVDAIHTDAGVYGLKDPVGQVDYFPNGGSQQPNCLFQTCSHSRAWVYFAESIKNHEAFLALKCKDYDAFKKRQCENDISPMGFASQRGTTGRYYLQTGEDSPYGLGKEGLTWKNNEGIVRNIGEKVSNLFG
ncbi:pancreatic lipase-related protein 2-like isoform X1 [Leguminivora glycinivorella]|uniref:pancreatic lipase-related protein 2-like isoform X1 n=1 Tax=Leguminivora glycinivorella TaxID=1035111 RepID=UPI00200F87C6|nr:pancreatic lipase-related protein 2-like isoform X1 [Leguminivora glycinivorella]